MLKKILLIACSTAFIIPLYSMETPDIRQATRQAINENNIRELMTLTEFDSYLMHNDDKGQQDILFENQYLASLKRLGLGKDIDIENDIYHPIMAFIGINYVIYNPDKDIIGNYLRHLAYDFLQDWSPVRKQRLLNYIKVLSSEELNKKDAETGNTFLHDILLWAQGNRGPKKMNLFQIQTITRKEASLPQIRPIIEKLLKCGANPYLRNNRNMSAVEALEIFGEEASYLIKQHCEDRGYRQDPDLSEYSETIGSELDNNALLDNEEDRISEIIPVSTRSTQTSDNLTNHHQPFPQTRIDSSKNHVIFKAITATALFAAAFIYAGYKIFYSSHNKLVKTN